MRDKKLRKYIIICRITALTFLVFHIVFFIMLFSGNALLLGWIDKRINMVELIGRLAWGIVIAAILLGAYFRWQLSKNEKSTPT